MEKAVVFSGSRKSLGLREGSKDTPIHEMGVTCLYLETSEKMTQENSYETIIFLSYLIWLATGLSTNERGSIEIKEEIDFEGIFQKYGKTGSFQKNILYGGRCKESPLENFKMYGYFLAHLNEKDYAKFENALQTYIWAKETQHMPNPHRKYTLNFTLYVTCIEQLAEEQGHHFSKGKKCSSKILCPDCGELISYYHKSSIAKNCEDLIRELIDDKNTEHWVNFYKKCYNKIRSKYIHAGGLSGKEREGGFIAEIENGTENHIFEKFANIEVFSMYVLESFLEKRAKKNIKK